MIYIACFAFSTLFAFVAHKTKKKWLFFGFSALSILLPVLLAGLRDYSIGIDTENYLNMAKYWDGAIHANSLWDYLQQYCSAGGREVLFALIMGTIAQTTGAFRVFLFLAHLVIMVGVYVGASRLKQYVRPELVYLLFMLLYFNNSLNIIRQYMAMALIFAVFADIEKRRFIRYTVVVLIAALIHTTAVLALAPVVAFVLLYPKKDVYTVPKKRLILVCSLIALGTICLIPAVKLCIEWGILGTKYAFFLKGQYTRMSITRMGLLILETAGIVWSYRKFKEKVAHSDYYLVHTLLFMCMQALSPFIKYGNRIVLYFALGNIVVLLLLPKLQEKKVRRWIWYGATVGLTAYFWYYLYVAALSSETYPYLFCF